MKQYQERRERERMWEAQHCRFFHSLSLPLSLFHTTTAHTQTHTDTHMHNRDAHTHTHAHTRTPADWSCPHPRSLHPQQEWTFPLLSPASRSRSWSGSAAPRCCLRSPTTSATTAEVRTERGRRKSVCVCWCVCMHVYEKRENVCVCVRVCVCVCIYIYILFVCMLVYESV